ncbi:FecCD family ABC transporter permease [Paracoccus wurundjeri]|uniref:FecCD family ABC transporter permease n=1 Tax=Paracoccus onubensis TaxID=1675788 RepID=UPI00272F1E64|nr:iron ABC transporter permease [Paracoccus onubensis]
MDLHGRGQRLRILCGALVLLLLIMVLSLGTGSRAIPWSEAMAALWAPDPRNDLHLIVRVLRVPRTLLAVMAGAALGIAGAMMQAVTRNPLAEPGILGINAGAAVAVVLAIMVLGLTSMAQYVWFGFLGAGLAGVAVFTLGRAHETGTDPVRLVLAGAGIAVVLGAMTGIVILNAPLQEFDTFRNWSAGSVSGREAEIAVILAMVLLPAGLLALSLAGSLNILSLGQEMGQALGVRPGRVWGLTCIAVMLLAGGATAGAGPIGFVGLVAPHAARMVCGPDYRWILPVSGVFAAILLLLADILGRIVIAPDEVAAGIVAAILGGPFFILLVRRFRLARI